MIEDVSKMSLDGFFIAEVRNNVDPDMEGKIAVYIPRLMYNYDFNETPFEKTADVQVNDDLIINSDDFQNNQLEVEESNYIWARPLTYFEDNQPNWKHGEKFYNSGSLRVPRIGSQIVIIFLNSDLQKCYYLPFSPTVSGDKLDSINCFDPVNFDNAENRVNIDVIRTYWDGIRIEVDTNAHVIKLSTPNGNYIRMSDLDIEIKGNVHMLDQLQVDKEAYFKSTVDIDMLTTCHDKLKVQSTTYVYGTLMNRSINLTTHKHKAPHGVTSGPF